MKILSEKSNISGNSQAPLGFAEWKNDIVIEHSHHGSSGNYECIVRRFKEGNDELIIILQTNQKHKNVSVISDKIHKIVTKE